MKLILSNQTLKENNKVDLRVKTERERETEKGDTSVSISADSTSMLISVITSMISTSNPGLSAVSIYSKLIKGLIKNNQIYQSVPANLKLQLLQNVYIHIMISCKPSLGSIFRDFYLSCNINIKLHEKQNAA